MNVLSLFDGISCGRIALERANIHVNRYYASEVDKYAIKAAQANWPDNIPLGDATKWRDWDIDWSSIDLVTGGFPCQAWSMAGKQMGDKDERGMLFWVMLDIIKHVRAHNKKAHFLIENVKMKKEFEEYITLHTESALGHVYKTLINSALVSAQNRNRYYWTSFPVEQPEDRSVFLKNILEGGLSNCWNHTPKAIEYMSRVGSTGRVKWSYMFHSEELKGKSQCVTSNYFKGVPNNVLVCANGLARKFTPVECERLQTIPDNYTNHASNTQRYKMIGNGWTVDVIAHILRGLK